MMTKKKGAKAKAKKKTIFLNKVNVLEECALEFAGLCGAMCVVYEFTSLTSLRSNFFIAAAAAVVVDSVVAIVIFDLDSWSFAAAVSSSMHTKHRATSVSECKQHRMGFYLLQNCITAQTQIHNKYLSRRNENCKAISLRTLFYHFTRSQIQLMIKEIHESYIHLFIAKPHSLGGCVHNAHTLWRQNFNKFNSIFATRLIALDTRSLWTSLRTLLRRSCSRRRQDMTATHLAFIIISRKHYNFHPHILIIIQLNVAIVAVAPSSRSRYCKLYMRRVTISHVM